MTAPAGALIGLVLRRRSRDLALILEIAEDIFRGRLERDERFIGVLQRSNFLCDFHLRPVVSDGGGSA